MNSDHIFSAQIESAKSLSGILSSLKLSPPKDGKRRKEITWALCEISKNSVKIMVEQDKCMQAVAEMKSNIFSQYRFMDDELNLLQFQFPLQYLIESLNLNSSSTGNVFVHLCYPGPEETLSLLLSENQIITDVNIKTRPPEEGMVTDFHFMEHGPINVKIILRSNTLHEALSELEWMDSGIVTLSIVKEEGENNQGKLSFSANGNAGNLTIDLYNTDNAFIQFIAHNNYSYDYKLSHLMRVNKALLGHNSDASIRINDRGTLSIQVVKKDEAKVSYVEFFMLPDSSTDESDEQEDDRMIFARANVGEESD